MIRSITTASNLTLAIYIAAFNLIDSISTWFLWIYSGERFVELNPLMNELILINPILAFGVKMAVAALLVILVAFYSRSKSNNKPIIRYGLMAVASIYFALILWQFFLISIAVFSV